MKIPNILKLFFIFLLNNLILILVFNISVNKQSLISDLLAWGLIISSSYFLLNLFGKNFKILGIIGLSVLITSQIYFLWEKYR